jgi:ABC-type dipeptide/oligopeptide/nickel transport system permease subunit
MSMNTAPPLAPVAEGGDIGPVRSGWKLAAREFSNSKLAVIGVGILVFFILFCFLGPIFYHGNVLNSELSNAYLAPGSGHPLGTTDQGYDEFALIMHGGQVALEVGFLAATVAIVIGALYGAISGLAGGFVDAIMMRIVDVILSIPFLFILLIVAAKYGTSVLSIALIIGGFSWLVPARLVRGEILTLRVRDFISAARVAGAGSSRLISRHLIPNALGTVIVNVTFQVADAIVAVAIIGYLGYGLQYPHQDWGDMVSGGVQNLQNGYWWLLYPVAICLVLVVMACNLVGDALRDSLDVRLRRR